MAVHTPVPYIYIQQKRNAPQDTLVKRNSNQLQHMPWEKWKTVKARIAYVNVYSTYQGR